MDARFWNRFAFAYDLATRSGDAGLREAASYIAGLLAPDACVLDAACGTGAFACAIASQVGEVIASDYASKMVEQTRAKIARMGLSNVSCQEGDITALPFAHDAFDAAIAGNMIHLLNDPQAGISELARVVKPKGIIAIPTYVNAEDQERRFLKLIEALGFSAKNEWTRAGYLDFVATTGLELIESRMFAAKQPLCVAICRNR